MKKLKRRFKRLFLWLIGLLFVPAAAFLCILAFSAITEYKPPAVEEAVRIITNGRTVIDQTQIKVTTFNIGYAGLDRKQDFFMDGGRLSRAASEEQTENNMAGILKAMMQNKSDFYLLQEVDESASRSFEMNQIERFALAFPSYNMTFAYNYKVGWVPVPWLDPMGKAYSGVMTLSKADALKTTRYALPGKEPLPKRYFDLKRCILENRYTLKNGKELIVVNVHLSAFDEGGSIRAQQVAWLIDYIGSQYDSKKNYLVIGGDWNHLLSKKLLGRIEGQVPSWVAVLPETIDATGFKVVYDDRVNTVRSNDKPYVEGENFETIIDGFLVSPNMDVVSVKGQNLKFEHSDHHPVTTVLRFK